MKIGYFADGPWGHLSFDKLLHDREIEICFVMVRYDHQDPVLIAKAEEYGIDVLIEANINTSEFIKKLIMYGADLFVSMSFNQIFHAEIQNVPKLGIINCHAGKLPYYRGRNILNWALINDEKEFGITVHYVDDGVDTGDIILQDTYEITDNDDYSTLLAKAYQGCPNILYRAIKLIQSGQANRIRQQDISSAGLYCGARCTGDENIDWQQTSREIFNFIRAVTHPAPGATTYHNGNKVIIWKAEEVLNAPVYKGISGQVLVKNQEDILVKTGDSYIRVVEYEGMLKTGWRLSNN